MFPQSAWPRGCKVTLVAFIWLFSTVQFRMLSQVAFIGRCIITLVAFVFCSPVCVFKCLFKLPPSEIALSHWLHLFDYSLCIFKWAFILPAQEDTKSHWLHFFPVHYCGFQISPQIFWARWYTFTYVNFFWFFPIWYDICLTSLYCVFSYNFSKFTHLYICRSSHDYSTTGLLLQ